MRRTLATLAMLVLARLAAASEIVAGPMLGHVSDGSARIWLQLNTTDRVSLRAIDVVTGRSASAVTLDVEGPSPFVCDAPLSNLDANRNYRIDVSLGNKPVKFAEPFVIRTAPNPGEPATFTLAAAGGIDFGPDFGKPVDAAKAIVDSKPRSLLFLGNVGYLPAKEDDFPKTRREAFALFTRHYRSMRTHPDLTSLFRSIPTLSTFGERDFGPADASRKFVYAQESLIAFQKYWANPDYGTPDAPGSYYTFSLGDIDFFVLDARSHRDTDAKTLLGNAQLDWLKKQLKASRATIKVIASSTPMLTDDTTADSWAHFKPERDAFLAYIFDHKIPGVVFLSSSTAGEITCRKNATTATYPLYELTAAPLTAKPADAAPANPLRSGEPFATNTYATLEFGGGSKPKRFVTFQLHDPKGKVLLEQTIFAGNLAAE